MKSQVLLVVLAISCSAGRPQVVDAPPSVAAQAREHDAPSGDAPGNDEITCDERIRRAAQALDRAVSRLPHDCREDADCVLVHLGTSCFSGCPASVPASQRETYERASIEADAAHCSSYEDDGCPRFERFCAEERAVCGRGTCDVALLETTEHASTP